MCVCFCVYVLVYYNETYFLVSFYLASDWVNASQSCISQKSQHFWEMWLKTLYIGRRKIFLHYSRLSKMDGEQMWTYILLLETLVWPVTDPFKVNKQVQCIHIALFTCEKQSLSHKLQNVKNSDIYRVKTVSCFLGLNLSLLNEKQFIGCWNRVVRTEKHKNIQQTYMWMVCSVIILPVWFYLTRVSSSTWCPRLFIQSYQITIFRCIHSLPLLNQMGELPHPFLCCAYLQRSGRYSFDLCWERDASRSCRVAAL